MTAAYCIDWEDEEDDDIDLCQEEDDIELSQRRCNCSNCMDCLGFSWRDFM